MMNRALRLFPTAFLLGASLAAGAGPALADVPETYRARWADPTIQQRISDNIEQYRKGDATLEIVGPDGRPLSGATVAIRQVSHDFLFGCNAFVLGQFETAEQNAAYEEAFTHLFNFVTVPFYWEGIEPVRGELRYAEPAREIWRRPPPGRYLPFAERHGLALKGHPLVWHAYNPSWMPKDPDELRGLYRKRLAEIAQRFGDKIPIWDVVNESLESRSNYPLHTDDLAYVAWAFREAAKVFPAECLLMINEVTSHSFVPVEKNAFLAQVRQLLDEGVPIEGLGFQYHFFRREALDGYLAGPNSDPTRLLDLYERFGEFELPLYVTEITIPSAGADGAAVQAKVVEDLYRLWFSVPRMAGITWWNLGDNTAVPGENVALGGLLDGELKPKPSYRALERLIRDEWTTRLEAQTDETGTARFRGFYGNYVIQVEAAPGQTREFPIHLTAGEPGRFRIDLQGRDTR